MLSNFVRFLNNLEFFYWVSILALFNPVYSSRAYKVLQNGPVRTDISQWTVWLEYIILIPLRQLELVSNTMKYCLREISLNIPHIICFLETLPISNILTLQWKTFFKYILFKRDKLFPQSLTSDWAESQQMNVILALKEEIQTVGHQLGKGDELSFASEEI